MEYLTFQMSQWFEIETYCKYLSCFAPSRLAHQKTNGDDFCHHLLAILDKHIAHLIEDYNRFVQPLFPDINYGSNYVDPFIGICARYQFYKTCCVIYRLQNSLQQYKEKDSCVDINFSLRFFAKTLLPKTTLYHNSNNEPIAAACKINSAYEIAFCQHFNNLCYPIETSFPSKKFDLGIPLKDIQHNNNFVVSTMEEVLKMNIVSNNYDLNNLLKWSAEVSSYPIIPPNLSGALLSTSDKRVGKCDLLSPGYDNTCYIKSINDPITCIKCKLLNLSIGQTDDVEQRDNLKCYCLQKADSVYNEDAKKQDESFFETLTTLNAQTVLNLILLCRPSIIPYGYGCVCADHVKLFKNHVQKYYKIMTDLQLVKSATYY